MATAGKILIIPKGKWDASATYEMLDMVKHNGASWVAKKTAIGIEPSEANAEYWHNMLDAEVHIERTNDCDLMTPEKDLAIKWYTTTNGSNTPLAGAFIVCVYSVNENTFVQEAIRISTLSQKGTHKWLRYYENGTYSPWIEEKHEITLVRNDSEFSNKPHLVIKDYVEKGDIPTTNHNGMIYCGGVFAFSGFLQDAYGSWLVHSYNGVIYHVCYANGGWSYSEITSTQKATF